MKQLEIVLRLTPEATTLLEDLQRKMGCDQQTVFRSAMALLDMAVQAEEGGAPMRYQGKDVLVLKELPDNVVRLTPK